MAQHVEAQVNAKKSKVTCGYRSCSGVLGEVLKEPHPLPSKCIDSVTGAWLNPLTREWIVVVELPPGYYLNDEDVWRMSNGALARQAIGGQYSNPHQSKRHQQRYEAGGPLQQFPYAQLPTPGDTPSLYILRGAVQAASWLGWAQHEVHELNSEVLEHGEGLALINHRQQTKAPAIIRCPQCWHDSYLTLENLATALPDE